MALPMASPHASRVNSRGTSSTSRDRLTKPLIREGGRFREASWDEALDLVAARLSEIQTRSGADALGFISSSKCTNEESYLMQKLARAVIGKQRGQLLATVPSRDYSYVKLALWNSHLIHYRPHNHNLLSFPPLDRP